MCLHITARASIPALSAEDVIKYVKDNESYYQSAIEDEALHKKSNLVVKNFTFMIIDEKEAQN